MVDWHLANHPLLPRSQMQGVERGRDVLRSWWLYVLSLSAVGAAVAWVLNRQGTYAGQLSFVVFGLALFALIPLAALISRTVNYLGKYLGETVCGVLEATFGNVPELAIGLFLIVQATRYPALVAINFTVIRGLLIGSVINNVLLVLGASVLAGGLRNGKMPFNAGRAAGFASMLALSVVGLALPTLATSFAEKEANTAEAQAYTSLVVGVILIFTYLMYLGATHLHWGERLRAVTATASGAKVPEPVHAGAARMGAAAAGETSHEHGHEHGHAEEEADDSAPTSEDLAELARREREREKARQWRKENPLGIVVGAVALLILTGATALTASLLVDVNDNVIKGTPLTPLSIGLILFPIICNFGELFGAFGTAWRNRVDEAMEVAAGSSVQVPLFVTPALVFVSFALAMGNFDHVLTLIFKPLELIVVGLVTFVYALVNLDGETTWLEGLQLLAFYAMIAVTAFALPGA